MCWDVAARMAWYVCGLVKLADEVPSGQRAVYPCDGLTKRNEKLSYVRHI